LSSVIEALEARAPLSRETIEEFLEGHEFPIVEDSKATFVWVGEADEVHLRHWIFGLPETMAFTRLAGSDLWFLVSELPAKSRVEYKLEIVRGEEHRLTGDPLNSHQAHDPYGANSVVFGANYEHPDWTQPDPDARRGDMEELSFASRAYGDERDVLVYQPARMRSRRRYPLLVVHDGFDYMRFSDLRVVLDNLIHRLEIEPMVVALTSSSNRLEEYADDSRQAAFLAEDLLPILEERYPLVGEPRGRALMGASFGAVASLSAAWRRQGTWGSLLLQSGSFVFTDIGQHDRGPVFDRVVRFVNEFRANPGRPAQRVFQTCGTYESMIYYNRSLVPLFQATGMELRYSEARDGHNWENWRDRLREGLSWLFPGPLWMVYE
jgi:enterochelin esterase family protein